MLKRLSCVLLLVATAAPARSELCTVDAVPAATLLLPYFEVNLARRSKAEETLFTINNASMEPTIAHVTFWTDLSLPTLAFDVFLTGFDVQEISLLDLFFDAQLPAGVQNIVGFTNLADLRNAHSGRAVDGQCYGQRLSGSAARGYVTIDNANDVNLLFPNDPGYYTEALGNVNQLWGQLYTFTKKYIEQETLIAVEASDSSDSSPGFTFYGRYSNNADLREPLATTWAAPWFDNSTHLIVWRDSTTSAQPFDCGDPDASGAYPLDTAEIIIFDNQEDATEILGELPFPAETQIVKVGGRDLPTFNYRQGWIFLNLNYSDGSLGQSFVIVRQDFRKRRSRAMATFLTHGCNFGNGSEAARTGRRGR